MEKIRRKIMKIKYKIIVTAFFAILSIGILTVCKNGKENNGESEIVSPYFNDGKSFIRDKERWQAALSAAIKLPLRETTNKDVMDLIGNNPSINDSDDDHYEYMYLYMGYNEKQLLNSKPDRRQEHIVLFFSFDLTNKLQSVGTRVEIFPAPASIQ